MYKKDSVRQLVESYKITLTNKKMQQQHSGYSDLYSYNVRDTYYHNAYMQVESVPVVTLDIEESRLLQIADKVAEFDDLMRDPETAQLLMEARFINRLKGNR